MREKVGAVPTDGHLPPEGYAELGATQCPPQDLFGERACCALRGCMPPHGRLVAGWKYPSDALSPAGRTAEWSMTNMSAEFFIRFQDPHWYGQGKKALDERLRGLPTLVKVAEGEYWLRGTEPEKPGRWAFDVRLWLREGFVELEISARPASVQSDLMTLFAWLRSETAITVVDEDGVDSGW